MQKPSTKENETAALQILSGGEAGRYIFEKDWSATPLGPMQDWPPTLRTTLRLLLHSKLPTLLFWDNEYLFFYNDAFHKRFGQSSHDALGKPAREAWSDGWQSLAPQIEVVMKSDEGSLHENQAIASSLNGQQKTIALTYSIGPVYNDEHAAPAGALVTCVEAVAKPQHDEGRFSNLVKEAPVGIVVVTGEDMKVEVFNAAFGHIIGHPEEDLEGRPLFDIIPDAEAIYRPIFDEVRTTGEPRFLYGQPYVIYKGDKRIKGFLNLVCQPCKDRNELAPGVMVFCHNVTEQTLALKRAKESEEKLRMALEGGDLGTFDFYLEEGKMYWSAKTKELFGLPPETAESFDLFALALHPDDREKSIAAADKAMQPEGGGNYENEYRTIGVTDGKLRWVRSKGKTTFGEDGKPLRFSGITQDVTQQKEAEERLRIAQKQLELTIENVPAAVYLFDSKANILYLNKQGRQHIQMLLGKDYAPNESLETLFRKTSGKLRYTDTDGVPMENDRYPMSVVMQTGKEATLMMKRIYTASSKEEWFVNNATPLLGEDGKVQFILSTATDYTEQKEIEQKLRESEARFRSLANAMPQIVWVAESNGEVTYYNDRVQAFDGIAKLPDGNWSWQGTVHPDDMAPTAEAWRRSVEAKTPYEKEHRIRMKDGAYRWHLSRALPEIDASGNVIKWYGTATDIHDQKLTEQAVKESEVRFRSLIEQAPVATCLFVSRQLRIEIANEKMLTYMGKGRSVLGRPLAEALPELKGQPFLSLLDNVFLSGEEYEARAVPATLLVNGVQQTNYFDYTFKPLRNADGQVYAIIDISVDVTEQVKSLLQLRESESRFRTLAETLPQMIWVSDKAGHNEYFSSQWKAYSGVDNPFEAWESMTHPDDKLSSTLAYRKAFADGIPFRSEVRLKNKSGEYRWHSSVAEPVIDSAGNTVKWVGALTDIHDQKTIAEKLEQIVADRTKELQRSNEDLQQFAHVASHDLKEPVRKVRTFSGRLREELDSNMTPQEDTYLSKIEGAADRMYSMIDGVLAYSSLNAMEQTKERVDLNDVLYDVGIDLEVLMEQKKATLDYSELPTIEGIPVLLHQLFYNLVNNSLKFAKAGMPSHISVRSQTEGSFVKITVKDNGIGFDQKQAEHIFQTFSRLNSKDRYEGTGLGLSLCKKIAERHGGTISAKGKEGEGACFEIVLPVDGVAET